MGIRIRKALGWGLKNVKQKDKRIKECDIHNRVTEAVDIIYDLFIKDPNKLNEIYLDFTDPIGNFNVKHSLSIEYLERASERSYRFLHSPEGLNVILFTQIEYNTINNNYNRYDDIIDYYDNLLKNKGCKNKKYDLSKFAGIYPHTGIEHIKGTEYFKSDLVLNKNYVPIDLYRSAIENENTPDEDYNILIKNYRPVIPPSIVYLVYFSDIFVDWKKTLNQFKPMLIEYWE